MIENDLVWFNPNVCNFPFTEESSAFPTETQNDVVSKNPCMEDKIRDSSLEHEKSDASEGTTAISNSTPLVQEIAFIPGLGVYSDSSDSESSSSDSDILPSLFTNFASKAK